MFTNVYICFIINLKTRNAMRLIKYKFSKFMQNLEHNEKTLKIILYIVPAWIAIYTIGLFYYLDYNFLTL